MKERKKWRKEAFKQEYIHTSINTTHAHTHTCISICIHKPHFFFLNILFFLSLLLHLCVLYLTFMTSSWHYFPYILPFPIPILSLLPSIFTKTFLHSNSYLNAFNTRHVKWRFSLQISISPSLFFFLIPSFFPLPHLHVKWPCVARWVCGQRYI